MTRFDHATEARALLIQGDAFTSSDMVLQTGEAKADVIALAQVHATLALVEQQRIANLVALSQAEDGNGWASEQAIAAVFREHWNDETGQGHCTIAPDIAAALGIEDAS